MKRGTLSKDSSSTYRGRGRGMRSARNHYQGRRFELEGLKTLKDEDPSIILQSLTSKMINLEKILQEGADIDCFGLILKMFVRISESKAPDLLPNLFFHLLMIVKRSSIFKSFTGTLTQAAVAKKLENASLLELHQDLVNFSNFFLNKAPSSACESIPECFFETVIQLKMILQINGYNIPSTIYDDIRQLNVRFKDARIRLIGLNEVEGKNKLRRLAKIGELSSMQPPDDFREYSVIPTTEDLMATDLQFIRPAIVDAPYKSVDDYLDIQFRLLREDFIFPLRAGIQKYIDLKSQKKVLRSKIDDMRLYFGVKFIDYNVLQGTHTICIANDRLKKIAWENSKRLLPGSLLCLSKDDFKTFLLATVAKRDPELLTKEGAIDIRLENVTNFKSHMTGSFILAESSVYFEVYRNVLRVLQQIRDDNLPMKELVLGKEVEEELPLYLHSLKEMSYTYYDLSMFSTRDSMSAELLKDVDILKLDQVLIPENLGLDLSQFQALKAALTQKLAIIHGPPGTGKTFIGLKALEVLLVNKEVWESKNIFVNTTGPILIVCYTNHALDQFVEGALKFTGRIVRIGGRSKSEVVNRCSLFELRKKHRGDVFRSNNHSAKRYELRDITRRLIEKDAVIHLIQRKVVIHEQFLWRNEFLANDNSSLDEDFLQNLLSRSKGSGIISSWLGLHSFNLLFSVLNAIATKPVFLPASDFKPSKLKLSQRDEEEEEYDKEEVEELERSRVFEDGKQADLNHSVDPQYLKIDNMEEFSYSDVVWSQERNRMDIEYWKDYGNQNEISIWQKESLTRNIQSAEKTEELILKLLALLPSLQKENTELLMNFKNPWSLNMYQRWLVYARWQQKVVRRLADEREALEEEYRTLKDEVDDFATEEDASYCKMMDIVAATTSGCAKYDKLIRHLSPKIVMMEEAAEILEAHTLVSMTSACEQLILIGDHQQLRPTTAVYHLAKDYNLDVSFFERMIRLGAPKSSLTVQHRMRPDIARLIVPSIYPSLENHPSVLDYPNIKGMKHNVFFLTHSVPETEETEAQSHLNPYEAEIALGLSRYLIQQGYLPNQITILTTYSGQLHFLMQLRKRSFESLAKVRITVVDNFQGEENDIIVLSLVRSNVDSKIGFLAIENRICVALSRAKHGLYIIGNMDSLDTKSKIWQSIRTSLNDKNQIGNGFELICQVHGTITTIEKGDDFIKVIEGGCMEKCNTPLSCGHICTGVCHVIDREHEKKQCTMKCERFLCSHNHKCDKICFEECGKCFVKVEKSLPCGHSATMKCHVDPNLYICKEIVDKIIPDCGHVGKVRCSAKPEGCCERPCDFRLDCGHSCPKTCHPSEDPDHVKVVCMKPCERKNNHCKRNHPCRRVCSEECGSCTETILFELSCGHKTKIPCGKNIDAYKCPVKVKKTIEECKHTLEVSCHITPGKDECKAKKCTTILECGHNCKKDCKSPCSASDCNELISLSDILPCGHNAYTYCKNRNDSVDESLEHLLTLCQEPCLGLLSCGHTCFGKCGQCFQGRLHLQCNEKCGRQLVCGHICEESCSATCPPCKGSCLVRCPHSRCKNKCSHICAPCLEPCAWNCIHKKCNLKCGDMCERGPCDEPCQESLSCNHLCIGLCGEICPKQCRICNKAEIEEFVLLGNETDADARFVCLPDCGHVIEVEAMDYWMKSVSKDLVGLQRCPRCNTPISSFIGRYGNVIRQTFRDTEEVKTQFYTAKDVSAELVETHMRVCRCEAMVDEDDLIMRSGTGKIIFLLGKGLK
ncbi:NFX1-type zinc finger-containing protein 1-like [Artemia franciscana]|uniref:NFX1-type zinc finger-containing protein 1-like n=1 Tax=Artemia franciscana TaxID=6661 RepID=UPI0032DBE31D